MNITEKLKDQYVAFLDVMGFSDLVNKRNLKRLESYFDRIHEVLNSIRTTKTALQSFLISDSIILIAPGTKKDFANLVVAIRRIQSSLLWKKILVRGAISYGEVFYENQRNIIVGKGFIKAYLLEKEAVYPRVIIDPIIIKNFGKTKMDFLGEFESQPFYYNFENRLFYSKSEFSKINDDAIFIDYANKVIKQKELNGNLKYLHETIVENLYSDQKLFTKYIWLRDYFLECLQKTDSYLQNDEEVTPSHRGKLKTWIQIFEEL